MQKGLEAFRLYRANGELYIFVVGGEIQFSIVQPKDMDVLFHSPLGGQSKVYIQRTSNKLADNACEYVAETVMIYSDLFEKKMDEIGRPANGGLFFLLFQISILMNIILWIFHFIR